MNGKNKHLFTQGQIEKFVNLVAFPVVGNLTNFYYDEATKLTYVWNGVSYDATTAASTPEDLAATLIAGNTSGAKDIVITTGQQLASSSGNSILDLRDGGTDSTFLLGSNGVGFGSLNKGYLYGGVTEIQVGYGPTNYLELANTYSILHGNIITFDTSTDAIVELGDDLGVRKFIIKNVDPTEVFAIDSLGNLTLNGTVDGINISTDVAANTAKVTNANHSGDVTGATVLTIGAKKVTLGMMADGVDGELITYDASVVAAKVATGTSGQVLTSNGVGTPPTFQASAGGGGLFDDLTDVNQDFISASAVTVDDGKIPHFDVATNSFVTDEAVTHGTVVINGKTSVATSTLAKGLPVYVDGFDSDLHVVELTDANGAGTYPCIGFTSEPLNDTDSKHIITFGKLTGIDTTSTVSTLNPNGETWAQGDSLYLSTTLGGLTSTRPTGVTSIQRIAQVLRVHATGGQLFVFNTARTAGLPNLAQNKYWVGDVNGYPVETDLPTATWKPNSIPLGSLLTSGATFFVNGGAGVYLSLPGNADDTFFFNDTLNKSGLNYDGSDLAIKMNCRLETNGGGGDDVGLILDYAFISDGDNSDTVVTNVGQVDYDVSTEVQNISFSIQLTTMTGVIGAHTIMITVTRNGTGTGQDSYSDDLEIISMEFVKI